MIIPLIGIGLLYLLKKRKIFAGKKMNSRELNKIKNIGKNYGLNFNNWTIVGIRGATVNDQGSIVKNSNRINDWNDSLILIKNNDSKYFPASLDAGEYYMNNPMNPLGTARLVKGLHHYKKGLHAKRPAFRSAEKMTVQRDTDKDKIYENSDKSQTETYASQFGINIHAAYSKGGVGRNSAGCQVLQATWESDEWLDFRDTLYNSNQSKYPYLVIESKDI